MGSKKTIRIKGMHCRSCELLVEKNLSAVPRVSVARVDHKAGTAVISYEGSEPSEERIARAVEDAGYAVGGGGERRPWLANDADTYYELLIAVGLAFIAYVALAASGAFDLNFDFGSAPAMPVVFLVGLAAGVSTCMALVGGIVLSMSARFAETHPNASPGRKVMPTVLFNVGRVVSFAVLGGAIGALGSVLTVSSVALGFLVAAAGIVMAWLGLKLTGLFPKLEDIGLSLPASIGRRLGFGRDAHAYSDTGAFVTGALTFFLPCGFTQAMQIYAISTGSFAQGALIMTIFALGTAPGLFGAGAVASVAKGAWGNVLFRFVGVVAIAFGLFNLSNGLTLAGFDVRPSESSTGGHAVAAEARDGTQILRMDQLPGGYRPNRLTVRKGMPVEWIINSTSPYTCAAYLVVPELGVSKFLEPGENVIRFTPTKAGTIRFSCSMGMYSGSITVTD